MVWLRLYPSIQKIKTIGFEIIFIFSLSTNFLIVTEVSAQKDKLEAYFELGYNSQRKFQRPELYFNPDNISNEIIGKYQLTPSYIGGIEFRKNIFSIFELPVESGIIILRDKINFQDSIYHGIINKSRTYASLSYGLGICPTRLTVFERWPMDVSLFIYNSLLLQTSGFSDLFSPNFIIDSNQSNRFRLSFTPRGKYERYTLNYSVRTFRGGPFDGAVIKDSFVISYLHSIGLSYNIL
jgi:hypothetical protein